MPPKTVDSRGASQERHDPSLDGDQACAKKVERNSGRNKPQGRNNVKKYEGNNWKSNARGSTAEGQSEVKTYDAESRTMTGNKRRRERNESRPKRSHEKQREGRKQLGEDRNSFKQNEMPRKENDLSSNRKDEMILKQSKNSKYNFDSSLIQDEMNCGKEERRSKDCNLSSGNLPTNEISSEKQEKEESCNCLPLDATDGEKKEEGSLQTTQLKLSSTPSSKSTQSRNLESKKERNKSSNTKSMPSSSISKHVTSKQHERKAQGKNESERKSKGGRTRTPRRAWEEGKDSKPIDEKKYPKSYSSVTSGTNPEEWTKRKEQSIKRNDAPISVNNNKSAKTSDKNFLEKVDKSSPNVALNSDEGVKASEHSVRTPPPGFKSSQSAVVVKGFEKEQKSKLEKTLETTFGDLSISSDAPRRPPPGFENVKPSVQKL